MKMEELKRCPFCGGEAVFHVWHEGGGVCVRCKECHCQTTTKTDGMGNGMAVQTVLNRWNKRVEQKEEDKE